MRSVFIRYYDFKLGSFWSRCQLPCQRLRRRINPKDGRVTWAALSQALATNRKLLALIFGARLLFRWFPTKPSSDPFSQRQCNREAISSHLGFMSDYLKALWSFVFAVTDLWMETGWGEQYVTLALARQTALCTLPCQSAALDNFTIHYTIFNHQRRAKSKRGTQLTMVMTQPD